MKRVMGYFKKIIIFIIISWLILFILLPNIIIIIISFLKKDNCNLIKFKFSFNNYLNLLDFLYIKVFINSLFISFITMIICLLIGYPFAWCLTKISDKKKSLMLFFLFLPFWVNSLIRIYCLKIFLGINGWFNNILIYLKIISSPIHIIYTPTAIIIGLVYILLPFMIVPIYSSFEKLDQLCIEAAKDLGAQYWKIFFYIIIPLTTSGIIAGCLLVFLSSMGMFYISDLMGGAKNLLIGNIIKNQFLNIRDWPLGAATSTIITLFTGILLILYFKIIKFLNKKEFKQNV
ncbi:spermidine/putrescine ABC transporter permease PotB [Enterobacteriaceae endosymbiont of Donacia bicoloricornis]|uniref:spermidine/putrescine ABC transporter permease PotB n=1 Tax=Enterobacteriaceae endosymbiont of Donacia bicoloricornis TaxID=2675772 RepID=UPI0014494643|nr:spermidine/putrescine ABC transporter permease PotB [Enterobacteriaceae endosymbiont of Donacia bicoloricornis]QJC37920.1 spermidine/putrescine ABC transporter permease PotB [Enterobacteriaceae endosymbiont of Donacia bicoloricornis]